MARILAISSQVVRGHIGLSAIVPALQRLGHEVWPLPTVQLSNHPGHRHAAGIRIDPAVLEEMVDALDRNGWLGDVDAIITGYLPSTDHVLFAASVVRRLRGAREVFYLCDPVLGDEPKGVYIDPEAAKAIRDLLVPLCDLLTPNRFELEWLAGNSVRTAEDFDGLATTGRRVVVTSAVRRGSMLDTVLIGQDGLQYCSVPYRDSVPHGTGDFFAGLMLAHHLNGASVAEAMSLAVAGVEQALLASENHDELVLAASQEAWAEARGLGISRWKSGE